MLCDNLSQLAPESEDPGRWCPIPQIARLFECFERAFNSNLVRQNCGVDVAQYDTHVNESSITLTGCEECLRPPVDLIASLR